MIKTKFHSKSSDLPSVFFGTTYRSPALWVKINASRPVYWQHRFKGCLSIQVQFISSWRALLRHSGLKIRIESVLIGVITQHRVFEVGTVLSFAFMGCWLIYLILYGKDKITAEWWECLSVSVGGFTMSGITPHKECVWLCAPKPAVTHHWLQSVFTSLASAASLWKVSKHWENNTSTWQTPLSNIFKVFNFQLSPPPKKKENLSGLKENLNCHWSSPFRRHWGLGTSFSDQTAVRQWQWAPPARSWSDQCFPPLMYPWQRCRWGPRCRWRVYPSLSSHSGRSCGKRHETSETWHCRWLGWWRCWGRCRFCRKARTSCPNRPCPGRSWPPPECGTASRAGRRGLPPLPASWSPAVGRKEKYENCSSIWGSWFYLLMQACDHTVFLVFYDGQCPLDRGIWRTTHW